MKFKAPAGALICITMMAMVGCAAAPTSPQAQRSDTADAQGRVDRAVAVINQMKAEPSMAALLRHAKGVLIVPDYGKAAWIIGGQGGVGVLVEQHDGDWSDPAFFTVGGLSIGLQAGGEAGAVAYILMTPKAVDQFETRTNKFSLGADAGLTVVNYSGRTTIASTTNPPADVIVWTGTKGLFGGVSLGVTDVASNARLDEAYYHGLVSVRRILSGTVHNRLADNLRQALATRVAER